MTRADDSPTRPLWQAALLLAVPIIVGEVCLALREHLRREHKARIRARERTQDKSS